MQIRDGGRAPDIERVLARALVAGLHPLNLSDAREGMSDRRAMAEPGAAVGAVLIDA